MAAAAAASANRQWHPGDLEVVVKRAIDSMKADGWLVEEEITSGRFRRGRGLRVDWACTPWPNANSAASDESQTGLDVEVGGQLVN